MTRKLLMTFGILTLLLSGFGTYSIISNGNPLSMQPLIHQLDANFASVTNGLAEASQSAKRASTSINTASTTVKQGGALVGQTSGLMHKVGDAFSFKIPIIDYQPLQKSSKYFYDQYRKLHNLENNMNRLSNQLSANSRDMNHMSTQLWQVKNEMSNTGKTLNQLMNKIDKLIKYTLMTVCILLNLISIAMITVSFKHNKA